MPEQKINDNIKNLIGKRGLYRKLCAEEGAPIPAGPKNIGFAVERMDGRLASVFVELVADQIGRLHAVGAVYREKAHIGFLLSFFMAVQPQG